MFFQVGYLYAHGPTGIVDKGGIWVCSVSREEYFMRKRAELKFIKLGVFLAAASFGCEPRSEARIVGPLVANGQGTLMTCGVDKGGVICRYVIRLANDEEASRVLRIPGVKSCLGLQWSRGINSDELLWVSGGEKQEIKRFGLAGGMVRELSSWPVDPNLLVAVCAPWPGNGDIVGLRVSQYKQNGMSGSYVGFLKVNEGTIHTSDIPTPSDMVWAGNGAFYMVHTDPDDSMMVMSVGYLNSESMSVRTSDVLREERIRLATRDLGGSVVYTVKKKIFRGNQQLAVLPEEVKRLHVGHGYLAGISNSGRTVYVLNEKGAILHTKRMPEKSRLIGLSGKLQSVYFITEDWQRIFSYNLTEETVNVVFDVE